VALIEVLGAVDLQWPLWLNVITLIGGLAVLGGALAIINHSRGRRALSLPERVGNIELAAFVVAPALLPLVFNGQALSGVITAVGNLLLLLLVWGVVGFGLLSIVRWAGARLLTQLVATIPLAVRAVPLLLLFNVVLFLTTEVWQVFADMRVASLIAIVVLLVVIGGSFVAARLPREVAALERELGSGDAPLRRVQRVNVGLVLFVSQALQVLVVSLAVAAFFVAFGLLAISDTTLQEWLGHPGTDVLHFRVLGINVLLTSELLRVAAAIAGISGLYYAISVLVDPTYRDEFLGEATADMRETFAARSEYLTLRAAC
jgi:hypothetical protein